MNFLEKLVKDAIERSGLKLAVLSLSVVSLVFGIMAALDLSKEPIVIERGCDTRLAATSSSTQTPEEIEAFIREAVAVRFDNASLKDPASYLAQDLAIARAKEQGELRKNSLDQRMIVRSVKLDGDHFQVEVDRLVAAGTARSAIPVSLVARISSKIRSLTNPFGLILTAIQERQAKHD